MALANKEALVCAGEVMLRAVQAAGATLLPVDSEHNAIFQSMADGNHGAVEKIVLTASGGPFRTASLDEMARGHAGGGAAPPGLVDGRQDQHRLRHHDEQGAGGDRGGPAVRAAEERIGVLVHPQSVIHGLVYYHDGSVLAQLGCPDMRIPIAHTLAWPERMATPSPRLDLAALARLDFFEPGPGALPGAGPGARGLAGRWRRALPVERRQRGRGRGVPAARIGFLDIAARGSCAARHGRA